MRYLFFTNTPAHVHLYRHVVPRLAERGHEVLVLARDYGCTLDLLAYFGLPYRVYGRCDTTKASLLRQLPRQYFSIFRQVRRYQPDVIFGMGAYAAHAGAITGASTILVLDSEPTSLDHAISRPFADALITPEAFRKDLGENHYTFPGFKECAYLHPEVYEPSGYGPAAAGSESAGSQRSDYPPTLADAPLTNGGDVTDGGEVTNRGDVTDGGELTKGVRPELGVGDDRYAIVRFNAFGSHHDLSEGGFTAAQRRELVRSLAEHLTVLVSDEGENLDLESLPAREFDLHPARLHDALAEADLLVADTQTMVTEAALLGTPAIRSNSFVGDDDMGNFLELERRGLVENVATFEDVLTRASDLAADEGTPRKWRRRRDEYVDELVNLTTVLVEVAEHHDDLDRVEGLTSRRKRSFGEGKDTTAGDQGDRDDAVASPKS